MPSRLKEETSALTKERDHIQYKLEKNAIFQQYLEKVLEAAEEVQDYYPTTYTSCFFRGEFPDVIVEIKLHGLK